MKKLFLGIIYFFLISTHIVYSSNWFNVVPLKNFLKNNTDASYIPCFNERFFEYNPFGLSINHANHPNMGYFDKTYILKIQNAQIQSPYGFVLYKNQFIKEFMWKQIERHLGLINQIPDNNIIHIPGKIAVISQLAFFNYWHWISEVLCRLALLEMHHIEYDYLYVNQDSKFMKDTLRLWGISDHKIICLSDYNYAIMPDEVIVPSLVSNVDFGFAAFSCYAQTHLLNYVKEKLLKAALKEGTNKIFSKKIFISRKDTNIRNIINEDDFFEALKLYEFERYELAKLSVVDQIHLFNQAEIIVCPQGTGLANCIFCNPNVKIIELFQGLNDATFWYLCQDLKLNYTAIQTTAFQEDYLCAWQSPTSIPLEIAKVIAQLIS